MLSRVSTVSSRRDLRVADAQGTIGFEFARLIILDIQLGLNPDRDYKFMIKF